MKTTLALAAGLLASVAAHAVTVTSTDLKPYANGTKSTVTVNGVTFQSQGGKIDSKKMAGYLGIGVHGDTNGEIDLGESLKASWSTLQTVSSFSVAFLFNGPEFGDKNETAKVSLLGSTSGIYGKLTAVSDTQAKWQLFNSSDVALGSASFISAISPATAKGAGVWTVTDPFASYAGSGVKFSALQGLYDSGKKCFEPSDFAFFGLSTAAIPEPGSYSMLSTGLFAVGFLMQRRRTTRKV
jgi:hypothetical protein